MSYPSNTAGIIQALIDLRSALSGAAPDVSTSVPVTAGESITTGDAVYMAADGKVYRASNSATRDHANVLGLAREAAVVDAEVVVILRGKIAGLAGLVPGSEYFLLLNGTYSPTPPIGGGSYLTMVGQAISASQLDVQPQPPLLLS